MKRAATSPFDLNAAVTAWREELADQPGLSPEDLHELELHLRESYAELRAPNLSEPEAFLLARHRLGAAAPLATEFIKAEPSRAWRERLFWIMLGGLGASLGQSVLHFWILGLCDVFQLKPADIFAPGPPVFSIYVWYLAVLVVPVIMAGRAVRRCWLKPALIDPAQLFPSRWRFVLAGLGAILGVKALTGLQSFFGLSLIDDLSNDNSVTHFVGPLLSFCWPFCLLAFTAWFLPRNSRAKMVVSAG